MRTADDALVVTFNGEIYNHVELRKELEKTGHQFQTDHSDTEVLLHGYREWGPAMLDRLNGMWAFAILDRIKNELFLSRDRFGNKPLFYYSDQRARKNDGGPHLQGAATVHKRRKTSDFARFSGAETSSDRASSDRAVES